MTTATSPKEFTGRHMLMIMIAFFGTVIGVNFTLAYYASHSWTGLVVENSFVASQEFDKETAKLQQAEAIAHVSEKYAAGHLTVTLVDSSGQAAAARNLVVKLGRPSHEGEDRKITLNALGAGVFGADVALAKGVWSGTISGSVEGHDDWQRPVRFVVTE